MAEETEGRARRGRPEEEKSIRYVAAEGEFEVEIARALNKWCVTVYKVEGHEELAQDYYPERWKALARAQDFVRLLNQRKARENEERESAAPSPDFVA